MKARQSLRSANYAPGRSTSHSASSSISVICVICGFLSSLPTTPAADTPWNSRNVLPEFYAEGASTGDLNGDRHIDIAYGPFWFAGPGFAEPYRFAPGPAFIPDQDYSDNFFSHIRDCNGDGLGDIIVFGFPGEECRLYLNPGPEKIASDWPMHQIIDQLCGESPHFTDLIPGGLPEIIGARDTAYGYYEAGDDPTRPWTWHAISAEKAAAKPFGHGMGIGDLNGDGRLDIIEKERWYEHPAGTGDQLWTEHRWAILPYGGGGAQILVDDVDGDGDNDLITSLNAHAYGISWFEQQAPGKFARHNIIGESSTQNPYGVAFSQPHAMALADIDGDGRKDFVTGKRFMAHKGRDPGAYQPAVLYWFRNTESEFVPHFIHNDSGVGVDILVADLDADGRLDIIGGSKKGLNIHLQRDLALAAPARLWKVPGGRPQEKYGIGLSPEESLARLELPPGFTADLIAAEPDLVQPIAMSFDARGRIWVIEGNTYPQRAPDGEGKDRILIFEDGDADGTFETRKIFADNINLASGIEIGFGGVFVGAAPHLLFYPDADGDDVPDAEPEILLDGWAYEDTHETLNSFTWGPDGWLYGCHGVFTHSNVGKPGAPAEERHPINAGVWRYHPVRRVFEIFAEGSSNPWGVDFDEHGEWFITACVIPHLYHLSQGGRYFRQAGQHFNPYIFDDIKTIADHLHYGDGTFASTNARGAVDRQLAAAKAADTSAVGGGHAHAGLTIYQADTFPPEYRGRLFFHNLHGHRLLSEHIEPEGSGFISRHRPDFALSHDHEHIGVTVMQGPDGALYTSDWHDDQTCHHRDVEIWDRSNGRLFRIRHGDVRSTVTDLPGRSDLELVATLAHANAFHARQAQRLLQERAAARTLDSQAVDQALTAFEKEHPADTPLRLRALWTRHVCDLATPEFIAASLADPDEYIRAWTIQLYGQFKEALPGDAVAKLEELAATDPSKVVRRYLASKLQRLPHGQRWTLATNLIAHEKDVVDPNIPLLCWYGIEPLVGADPARALALVGKTAWPQLREFITRRAALAPAGRAAILGTLAKAKNPAEFTNGANQLLLSLANLPPVDQPEGWEAAKARGKALTKNTPAVIALVNRLGARFGDPEFFPPWRALAREPKAQAPDRVEALELLTAGGDPELGPLARELLDAPALRQACVAALRKHPGPETATALIERLDQFSLNLRNEAINLLASRPDMALALLQAIDEKRLEASLISPVLLDQFDRFDNPGIEAIIERHWARGAAEVDLAQLARAIDGWQQRLDPKVMARADAARGRAAFQVTCGACHTLFGQGIALGPDLTGSNRADLRYLLENVLAPSAVVGVDYMLQVFTMKDGTVLSGILREENPDHAKIALPGGATLDIKLADVERREQLAQSLMTPGLFEALPFEQVADLVKYLASPAQVPLPGTAAAPPATSSLAEGATRIEAEDLLPDAKVTGGQLRLQSMTNFKGGAWSGRGQLFWVKPKPGDTLTLPLEVPNPGNYDLAIHPTTAPDYAEITITLGDRTVETDLYTPNVLNGEPLTFKNIPLKKSQTLTIKVTGANPDAKPSHMVGLDRLELTPVR